MRARCVCFFGIGREAFAWIGKIDEATWRLVPFKGIFDWLNGEREVDEGKRWSVWLRGKQDDFGGSDWG